MARTTWPTNTGSDGLRVTEIPVIAAMVVPAGGGVGEGVGEGLGVGDGLGAGVGDGAGAGSGSGAGLGSAGPGPAGAAGDELCGFDTSLGEAGEVLEQPTVHTRSHVRCVIARSRTRRSVIAGERAF